MLLTCSICLGKLICTCDLKNFPFLQNISKIVSRTLRQNLDWLPELKKPLLEVNINDFNGKADF